SSDSTAASASSIVVAGSLRVGVPGVFCTAICPRSPRSCSVDILPCGGRFRERRPMTFVPGDAPLSPPRPRKERMSNVSGPIVRRLRLPPTDTSPAAARGAVSAVLDEADLGSLRAEALLLTSELVTNGVIHARTDVEIEIVANPDGVRVTVTDFAAPDPSLVVTELSVGREADVGRLDTAAPAEGGRGLLLVSQFASRWGTSHERGGRQVWFQLDRYPGRPQP